MTLEPYFDSTLDAARAGAGWAWEVLYRDLAGSVAGYLRGRGAEEVEDLVSETFLSVAKDVHRFKGGEGDFRSWVFTIAHRRMQDAWRAKGRQVPMLDREDAETLAENNWLGDAEHDAMTAMSLLEVHVLIDHLTAAQRDVVLLRVVGDLSVAETAKVLHTSEAAVRALQSRAVRDLRKKNLDDPSHFGAGERLQD
ncbi:RNA polymerase sigma factor [Demequina lutea]|uniref:RNA polymerase sigma-70 factor (ECF subfamily) n=1 Tax=Demequina lutea TaxID=431489 RepID=A0A7Y9Z955_9MICO|nr:RNA polymerase sigma factor [Demequina lutea]NYI40911.1 RNA polymerase sigma-70 factor (ECF subfamily) [Demequina lutea]